MNRTKLLTIAVIGLLLINLGTLAVMMMQKPPRPPHGDMPPPRGEGPKQIIIDRLHFDVMQEKDYELLIADHKMQTKKLHDSSKELHDKLYSLLKGQGDKNNESDSLILEIANNQKSIENLNFSHFNAIKNICKGTQVEDFNKLVEELGMLFSPQGPSRH
ncbi:hypothetical protein BH10BAC1_BH10BAC1_01970 [soil metagenome]